MPFEGMFFLASAHGAGSRVGIALLGLVVFGAVATRRWERPFVAVPVVVLCLIAAGWLFAATLVWGTGYATKVRLSAGWAYDGNAWQWTALLALALAGVFFLALALRSFAHESSPRAWGLSALSGVAFIAWSAVVRYSVAAAAFVLLAGVGATAFIGFAQNAPAPLEETDRPRLRAAIPLLLITIVLGCAWAFFAFAWLVVGPEGRGAACDCWADNYNDWQYWGQFLVAVGGAVSLLAAAASYVTRRQVVFRVTGVITVSALCGWIAFLVTGYG